MSHEKLWSHEMQEKLRSLCTSNDPFWVELTHAEAHHLRPVTGAMVAKDLMADPNDEDTLDNGAISLHNVISATHKVNVLKKKKGLVTSQENGHLVAMADADDLDKVAGPVEGGEVVEEGRGK